MRSYLGTPGHSEQPPSPQTTLFEELSGVYISVYVYKSFFSNKARQLRTNSLVCTFQLKFTQSLAFNVKTHRLAIN